MCAHSLFNVIVRGPNDVVRDCKLRNAFPRDRSSIQAYLVP